MSATRRPDNEAFRRFVRRVWQQDVAPLLRGERAAERRKAARVGGKVAAGGGLLIDGLLRLKGRPFTRFLTVMGTTLGALLPDVWDWRWYRENASPRQKKVVREQVQRRAGELPLDEALALFGLQPGVTPEELRSAWHAISRRWHPDKAPDERRRSEYHVRFVAYQAAYERLRAAYESGELGVKSG
ncbi:MAG: J domain-containing protein [Planctomycetota bacterium]